MTAVKGRREPPLPAPCDPRRTVGAGRRQPRGRSGYARHRCLDLASASGSRALSSEMSIFRPPLCNHHPSGARQHIGPTVPNTHCRAIGGPRRLAARSPSSPLAFSHSFRSLKSQFNDVLIAGSTAVGGFVVAEVARSQRYLPRHSLRRRGDPAPRRDEREAEG